MSNEADPFLSELLGTEPDGKEKFDTCSYRSEFEESRFIKTCHCNSGTEMKGYDCRMHNIFPVDENFCKLCKQYLKKDG